MSLYVFKKGGIVINIFELYATIGLKDDGFSKGIDEAQKSTGGLKDGIGGLIKTVGNIKLVSMAFDSVKTSMTAAFNRIDTMEQFSRVMTVLTGSTDEADVALADITKTVTGTAYGMTQAATGVQNFVTSGMDLSQATSTVGTYADAVSFYGDGTNSTLETVLDALGKTYTSGKVYAQNINSMMYAGIPVYQIYAEAVGSTVEDVKESFSTGAVDAQEFVTVLTAALEEGTASFPSITGAAQAAGASWSGTFDNMQADVTKAVTDIVQNIDVSLSKNSLPTLREGLRMVSKGFASFLSTIGDVISKGLNVLSPAIKIISNNLDILLPGLLAVKAGFMLQGIVNGFTQSLNIASNALKTADTVTNDIALALTRKAAAEQLDALAAAKKYTINEAGQLVTQKGIVLTQAETASLLAETGVVKLNMASLISLISTHKLYGTAQILSTAAMKAFNNALIANPIGAAIAGVVALTGAITLLVKVFRKESDSAKALKAENERLKESQESLAAAVEETNKAYEDSKREINSQASANKDLADKITELHKEINELNAAEEDSSVQRRMLTNYTELLNESTDDLNLSYDEMTNTLSHTTDQIYAQIGAYEKEAKLQAEQEYYIAKLEERAEIEQELSAITDDRIALQEEYEAGSKQYQRHLNDLNKTEAGFKETLEAVNEELSNMDDSMRAAVEGSTEAVNELNVKMDAATSSISSLSSAVSASKTAHKENSKAIEDEQKYTKKLAEKVVALNRIEDKSEEQKAELRAAVNLLNNSVEDLNLAYDEEREKVNLSTEALYGKVNAYKAQETLTDAQERMNEILKEQADLEEEINGIMDQRKDWSEAYQKGEASMSEYQDALVEIEERERELQAVNDDLETSYNEVSATVKNCMETMSDSSRVATEEQKEALNGLSEKYQEIKEKVTDVFETIDKKAAKSAGELTKTLDENRKTTEGWADNLETLATRTIDENGRMLNEGLIDQLREAGPEYAKTVESLKNASDTELLKLNDAYEKAGGSIAGIVSSGWNVTDEAAQAAGEVAEATNRTLTQKIAEADFESIGADALDGYVAGITGKIGDVEDSTAEAVEAGVDSAKAAQDSNSPSKVYQSLAEDAVDGYVLGVEGKTDELKKAMKEMIGAAGDAAEESGKDLAKGMMQGIDKGLAELPGSMKKNLDSAHKNIESFTTNSRKTFETGMRAINTTATTSFATLNATAARGSKSFSDNILNTVSRIPGQFVRYLNQMVSSVKSWGNTLVAEGKKAMNNYKSAIESIAGSISLYSAGQNVVEGMWQGMQSKRSYFYNNVHSYFKGMVTEAKKALDINSPSRVMAELGGFTVEGFMVGLKSMERELERMMDGIFSPDLSDLNMGTGVAGGRLAAAGAGVTAGGNVYNFTQNLQSVAQTPYENAQYAQAMMRKARWQK